MPIINIKIARGRSIELKQKLVEKITTDISEMLDVKKEWVTVLIDEYERENWATDGIVITSYSIHYTKLYELRLYTVWSWALSGIKDPLPLVDQYPPVTVPLTQPCNRNNFV